MHAENKRTALLDKMKAAKTTQPVTPQQPIAAATHNTTAEPIAIVGLAARFPQSADIQAFWQALDEDRNLIEEIPAHRFNMEQLYDATRKDADKIHTKWAGLIADIRQFDPAFFGILPAEADLMDPRRRLLLMTAWHAMEDAGYTPETLGRNTTGVFVAAEEDEYRQCLLEQGVDTRSGAGGSSSLLANQLSYTFDLKGPSEFVNTMCSGAAVAIHRAVKALRTGEIEAALVGAANLLLHPDTFIYLSRSGQLNPDHCVRSFGAAAKGFLRADGVAAVVLKPLSKAVADNDHVYAVIRHTAVNYNGQGGMSMAAPNISAHTDLIRTCYREAGIDPRQLTYIEAQGMGNPVADLAEWTAFNNALQSIAREQQLELPNGNCQVSTLKPMLGHMHAASAMGALFKIIRSLQTNTIHHIQGYTTINPDLDTDNQPCRLATTTAPWPRQPLPRLAALHAYSSGGNNAHLLVEEYRASAIPVNDNGQQVVIPCSAASEEQCVTMVNNLIEALQQHPEYSLASIAYTLQQGRRPMKYRVAIIANSRDSFMRQAVSYLSGVLLSGTHQGIASNKNKTMAPTANDPVAFASAWVQGATVPWQQLMTNQPVQRLSLPVYPFNTQPYWMEETPAPGKSSPAVNTTTPTEDIIRQLISQYLKTTPAAVDIHEAFSEMGFDSLLVTSLAKKLRDQHQVDIEAAAFFEHTTPAKLIAFIDRHYGPSLHTASQIKPAAATQQSPKPGNQEDLVAVIGLAGAFPQADNLEAFWQNLLQGQDCIEEVPAERWSISEHFTPSVETADKTGKSYGKWGGFLKDLFCFDPLFFNISPTEAAAMNPKERRFLQCAWHVLEDAGYTPQGLHKEQVGVFAGVTRSGLDPYKVSMFPVANRVSYTFNFRGPSFPVDTACSSSLVAIHEACRHIQTGECTLAIAGGVHAFLGPTHLAALSGLHMLSPDGRSRSFGESANGMVPGEGVGAVLLKPLSRAIADHDHIYGVIRATATNHGGKANGFTVPNPQAHTQLIQETLAKANIDARAINYVEAHGTGTTLGDPIEIRGLNEAFKQHTSDTQYCPIGSVKSNIGHLEAAAGISGLTKILLQMKAGKLAPSLHARQLNPHININATAFYVQQELADWEPRNTAGERIPRLACLSSFGAGGANAHLIVEEAPGRKHAYVDSQPQLILLSAKNRETLHLQVEQLLAWLQSREHSLQGLADMAYTLQTGRVALEERWATQVATPEQLASELKAFLSGTATGNQYAGNYRRLDTVDRVGSVQITSPLTSIAAASLLEAWTKGATIDWEQLHTTSEAMRPYRISLPLYPFAKEYFGLPQEDDLSKQPGATIPVLHPLVHTNQSTFASQRYSVTLTGDEHFLRDHLVYGQKVLPGVAYLEMVHAAASLAVRAAEEDSTTGIQLQNIGWVQPVIVQHEPRTLTIDLLTGDDGSLQFEVSSDGAEESTRLVHSQGTILMTEALHPIPVLDLAALQQQTSQQEITAAACYEQFEQLGIAYGPAHQAIELVQIGNDQVLAKLRLPDSISDTCSSFQLHPSLADAAFQAIMGYMIAESQQQQTAVVLAIPYALEQLIFYAPCTTHMWAHITRRRIDEQKPPTINNLSFNLDLSDEQGTVCASMHGFVSREYRLQEQQETPSLLYLQPAWKAVQTATNQSSTTFARHVVLYPQGYTQALPSMPGVQWQSYTTDTTTSDQGLEQLTLLLLANVQQHLKSMPAGEHLTQVLLPKGDIACHLAVSALLKTAARENPRYHAQVIAVSSPTDQPDIQQLITHNAEQPEYPVIRYVEGKRYTQQLEEYTPTTGKPSTPWRDNGIYLITGGAGGIGVQFAQEIIQQVATPTIILTGRSRLSPQKERQLAALQQTGATVTYRQADITQANEVQELVAGILHTQQRLDGVIHAAGIIRDNYLIRKTAGELQEVMAPKVKGLIHLDAATSQLPLQFFITCASVAGAMGNIGQADYAVANAYMDQFMQRRHLQEQAGQRSGRSLSVNWPLWKDGGMQVDATVETMMKETLGMRPLATPAAFQALYTMLATKQPQMMVLAGQPIRLRQTFLEQPVANTTSAATTTNFTPNAGLQHKVISYLKKLLSGVINLAPERIDANISLDEYGIDSIMVMKMTTELEKAFGSLSKTLFFEYQNIKELSQYFLTAHSGKLATLLGVDATANPIPAAPKQATKPATARFSKKPLPVPAKATNKESNAQDMEIAIIGVSGKYPKANNLQEYWHNLQQGRNCITEIPKERWDHTPWFDEDRNKPLKTNSKWGGFLEGIEEFDPLFFNISPREAEVTDPQERIFLQCAYETIQDAGYTRQQLLQGPVQGRVGVFAGVMWTEYQMYSASETILGRTMVLSSSSSSIANRVSYCCNFNGPSLALDTMCSSSLTAIHIACQSLRQGDCEMAIAGGVNLTLHPNKYLILGYGKLASSKGLCESFGAGGDGYVPSEGVGAVLLKPLAKAIADGDQIYGVVKGTAVNHGGKVNGYSVPNPRAQAKAVAKALTSAGFHPHTVSYLEAHGTGTALGDPIELAGLTEGFHATGKQYCAIGSVKSNIGHCESAAGVAGITKVLLQLKHRQLVPSLHSTVLNPNIDFANTPFVVQQELTEWKRPVVTIDGHTQEYPRRAGISSFGAGGSNAHILIEEYIPVTPSPIPLQQAPVAILLSAKTADGLQRSAQRLLTAIQQQQYAAHELTNIAYTLQTGREMMEERLALEVNNLPELAQKLTAYLAEETGIPHVYIGKARSQQELLAFFEGDDLQATIDTWLQQKKYTRLLRLWTGGYDIDWTGLYTDAAQKPQRISLPTYPFLRTRYWPNIVTTTPVDAGQATQPANLHPLLHANTSTFAAQQFSATFNGQEPFLKDHVVDGKKLLPGVAYIEMIHEAMKRSAGSNGHTGIRIDNMAWIQPLSVNGHPEQVDIRFNPTDQQTFRVEIINRTHPGNGQLIVHSEGIVQQTAIGEDRHIDIQAIRQQPGMQQITAATCYALYERIGIQYGPAHRAIDSLYANSDQLLAQLILPATVAATASQYHLHPSLLDAALQAVIGFAVFEQNDREPLPLAIPFAIRTIHVMHPCTTQMWASISRSRSGSKEDQLSFDIDLCDESGKLCVQIEGFTSRIVKQTTKTANNTLLLQPRWSPQPLQPPAALIHYDNQLLFIIDQPTWYNELNRRKPATTLIHLQASGADHATRFEQYATQAFEHIKALYSNRVHKRTLIQVITGAGEEQQLYTALTGLLQTAQWENPLVTAQVIAFSDQETIDGLLQKLQDNAQSPADTLISYRQQERTVNHLQEYHETTTTAMPTWRNNGVYLITGGAGGLGIQMATAITAAVQQATIILTGRSTLQPAQQQSITTLNTTTHKVVYQTCDITDEASVQQLVQHIKQTYGALHGIIHCAGILRDNFIIKKSAEELQAVMAPKVKGLYFLDQATRHEPIEVFINCSSVTGYTGNAGQADYALANAWMDRFATYRNLLVTGKQRSGKTISVNWPLWKEGGMQITPEQEKQLHANYGLVPMDTAAGLVALYKAIAAGMEQVMVLQGDTARIRNIFVTTPASKPAAQADSPATPVKQDRPAAPVARKDAVLDHLKAVVSGVIKLPVAQINPDKTLEEYGIDSVMVMQMTNELEKAFGNLPKTLFFEYNNLTELADYLRTAFPVNTLTQPITETPPVTKTPASSPAVAPPPAPTNHATRFNTTPPLPAARKEIPAALDVAIVGLAGRYPQAANLEAFWNILKEGINCITEVPDDRWDHNDYYDQEKNKLGKTYGKWGGFIDGIDEFDPLFFGISAREAAALDPQERLFLQCAYETLEDAGYTRSSIGRNKENGLPGSVGVYAGVMWEEYQLYGAQSTALGDPIAYAGISGSIANRVSYYGNFNGMSITLNTMCSSSLTAIHLACQAISQGECEAAIAGGVNLSLHPNKYMALGYGSFLSTKGLCESFGAGGDGYVPGEGVGAVLLKPLAQAIEDKDHIYGVIKGTAVNHGGKTNSYTVPNPHAQANVIDKAMKRAGFAPQTISYLEAHGTGTALGDPIEITGLNKAFQTTATGFCAIGSVKSNIGHCESASGIAGLTKVLLQMKHRQLVPSLHADTLNPNIDFPNSCFTVQRTLVPWKRPVLNLDGQEKEYPLRAGLSSFGAGGTNAHILVEEYIPDEAIVHRQIAVPPPTSQVLILLSARTEEQLQQQVAQLHSWITQQPALPPHTLHDMAYTLQVGREAHRERLAIAVNNWQQVQSALQQYAQGIDVPTIHRAQITEAGEALNGKALETTRLQQINGWLANGQHDELLAHWVKGLLVDWQLLYTTKANQYQPHRIALPGYPFARERYWLPDNMPLKQEAAPKPLPIHPPAITTTVSVQPTELPAAVDGQLQAAIVQKLREQFAALVHYPVSRIDPKEPLENYGIDSVMIVQLNNLLATAYGELPATLFYEFQTIFALGQYLTTKHSERSAAWVGIPFPQSPATIQPGQVTSETPRPKRKVQPENQQPAPTEREPIAIIGLSGRYPQANDIHTYWENLKAGKDCITEIPADRWNLDHFFHPDSAEAAALGKSYGKWGGFIDGMADFDPRFFNLSPKEARGMDPHVRHFLEASWQVLEDAGYTRRQLQQQYHGQVGVFAGITRAGFACYGAELMQHGQYVLNTMSAVANRVSYFLNLKGPSVPVDTMCSSSLTAIHDAMESLYKGECAMAIAGGVNLLLHPSEYVLLSANNFLSTDGRCRSFGAGGTGYVPGEGAGAVLLKPLSQAKADNDQIYAVIHSSSVNHGGKTNGYTVPNPVAQGDLIRRALDQAGIHARNISYVEAHGTGTLLGDPIEIAGLTQAYSADTTDTGYCALGSSKSNIGHLEAAAGIAGLTKIILQMQHGMLVPSLHADTLNPNIQFNQTPFVLQRSLAPWERPVSLINGAITELPRMAGLSSFGAGGSNAHLILGEYI